jgi:uncharacterized SAM-binding protein YcdF (DUF218 family)
MNALLSPMALLLAGIAGLLLAAAARRRALRLAASVAIIVALLGMTPWVANALVAGIEAGAEDGGTCRDSEVIVFLSGGFARAPRGVDDFAALTPRTLERVAALLARGPDPRPLRIAGGGPHAVSEARVIAVLLQRLDAAPRPLSLEETSRTTWGNARAVRRLQRNVRRIVLATSALHLPRAKLAFEAHGFEVCGWPLNREALGSRGPWAWWPGATALRKTEAALHEWVGRHYYAWRARRGAAPSNSS